MNAHRIKAILADPDFVEVVDQVRVHLTKTVMAEATTQEDRDKALAEHHALNRLIGTMRSEAQNAKED